jgi:hypothetical protein
MLNKRVAATRRSQRFEDTMKATRTLATAVTTATLTIAAASIATAGDQYVFPSANGVQLSATPAPAFVPAAPGGYPQANMAGAGGNFVYGHPSFGRHEPPPLPVFAYAPQQPAPYANHLMSHALAVAPYANYAADYARLFAPSYAVSAWTDRVFGVIDSGYGAVDGWTAAAYGLPRLHGPNRRSESPPDLSTMPPLRAHPELDRGPTFRNEGN